jgi:hypothetical protein
MTWIKMGHNESEKNFGSQNMDIHNYISYWLSVILSFPVENKV